MQSSSETQGQLVGAGKSQNGREKNSGEEKSRTHYLRLTFLRRNFFLVRFNFCPPPLTAPGSPRMKAPLHGPFFKGRQQRFFNPMDKVAETFKIVFLLCRLCEDPNARKRMKVEGVYWNDEEILKSCQNARV